MTLKEKTKDNTMEEEIKYYRHKEKGDVVCEVIGKYVRFGRWVWKAGTCSEVYTHKGITEDFKSAFEGITQRQFNDVWGAKLELA